MRPERLVVASSNPIKIEAVRMGYERIFGVAPIGLRSLPAPSGVAAQPMGDDETYRGALQRAQHVREVMPDADAWVGVEGGIFELGDAMFAFAWAVVLGHGTLQGAGRAASYQLPADIAELVRQGDEFGDACDKALNVENLRQKEGLIGILTNSVFTRASYYSEAVMVSFVPFLHQEFVFSPAQLNLPEDA